MKLGEVQLEYKVPTGRGASDDTQRLRAVAGWEMTLDAGIITAKLADQVLLIPLSRVVYAKALPPEPKKAPKPGPVAA